MSVLSVEAVSAGYRSTQVLEEVTFEVGAGESVALLGPSGCGKSTLLHVCAGLYAPTRGRVVLAGDAVGTRGRRPGYMQQKDLLLPWRTIVGNAALPLQIAGIGRREAYRRALEELEAVGLADVAKRFPHQLSGGMRQRAALARTVLHRRDMLLLDEPFAALDAITRAELHAWLERVATAHHSAILLVTHDVEEALILADRILVIGGNPARITQPFRVDRARPRERSWLLTPQAVQLRAEVVAALAVASHERPRPSA